MQTERRILICALLAGCLTSVGTAAADDASVVYAFDVYYDDRPIGTHRFEVDREGAHKTVRSLADFHVQVLFLSLYRYRHEAEEYWQDGCLQRLRSRTDDNGRHYEVAVAGQASALRVNRSAPEPEVETLAVDCAASFAYWDLDQLQRAALINSQTGSMTPVTLTFEGEDSATGVPALRYSLQPAGLQPITLWYRSSDRHWLGLQTRQGDGLLSYRLVELPSDSRRADQPGI